MNKVLFGLLGAVMVVGAWAMVLQRAANRELRAEIAGLRSEVREALRQREAPPREEAKLAGGTAMTVAGGGAEEQRTEIAKLRADIRALAASNQEMVRQAQAATQAARGESPIPVKLIPVGEWKNAGRATVNSAVETVLWAAAGGDVEALRNSIVLDASGREKADALFARLPEASRAEYGSPEKLIALFLAKDAAVATGMQILGQRDVTPEIVGVRIRVANDEGKTSEQNLGFRRTNDGLRLIINDKVVEKYARQLAGGK